jgi:PAS domain S-box-containing protein
MVKQHNPQDIHSSVVEECPFGIVLSNLRRGLIEQANPAVLRTLGYTLEEFCAIPITELYVIPDERDRFLALLEENGSVYNFSAQFRQRGGGTVHALISGYMWTDPETGENYLQSYLLDVSRQRELEETLNHSHRMEAVGRLAGGVAHDFNNITQAISLSCELALQQSLNPELDGLLRDILRQTARAAQVTRQLLAFSRRQVLQPRAVDLNDCLRHAMPLLRRSVGVKASVELRLEPSAEQVFVDPEQLTLVLMHLADNAREAMTRGGVLTLSTAAARMETPSEEGRPRRSMVLLSVSDNGRGMDEATLHRIFEPFFSTKETPLTTGLGLATVHGIIAQSKGRIECSSQPGHGTTFRIFLPVAHHRAARRTQTAAPQKSICVLLAEDDPIVNKLLGHGLRQAGFSVDATRNGQEALEMFDAARHHVLVSDILMPQLDGLELATLLRARKPELPIVLVSGFSQEIGVFNKLPPGNLSYLQKPFQAEKLIEAIHSLLAQSGTEQPGAAQKPTPQS